MLRQFFSFFMPRLHWHPCKGLDNRADIALAHWLLAPGPSFMLPFPATHWRSVRRRGLHVSSLEHKSPATKQSSLLARITSNRAVRGAQRAESSHDWCRNKLKVIVPSGVLMHHMKALALLLFEWWKLANKAFLCRWEAHNSTYKSNKSFVFMWISEIWIPKEKSNNVKFKFFKYFYCHQVKYIAETIVFF